jgi:hypothetical protein
MLYWHRTHIRYNSHITITILLISYYLTGCHTVKDSTTHLNDHDHTNYKYVHTSFPHQRVSHLKSLSHTKRVIKPSLNDQNTSYPSDMNASKSPVIYVLTKHTESPYLDKHKLLTLIIEHNPTLHAAYQTWRSTQTLIIQSQKLPDPTLSYHQASLINDQSPYVFKAQIQQTLPWPGQRSILAKIAQNQIETQNLTVQQVYHQLRYQAQVLYYQYYESHKNWQFNQQQQKLVQQLMTHSQSSYLHIPAMQKMLLQSRLTLQSLTRKAITIQRRRHTIIVHLKTLLHWKHNSSLRIDQRSSKHLDKKSNESKSLPLFPSPPTTLSLPHLQHTLSELILLNQKHHPYVHTLYQHKKKLTLQIQKKYLNRFPNISLYSQYQSMWMNLENRWWLGVSINLPIWRDVRDAEIIQLQLQIKALEAEIKSQLAVIEDNVRIAYLDWESTQKMMQQDREQYLPLAQNTLDHLRGLYEQKQLTLHEWIQVAQQQLEVEWEHEKSKVQACLAYLELYRWINPEKKPTLDSDQPLVINKAKYNGKGDDHE